jgi:hypothetical protein
MKKLITLLICLSSFLGQAMAQPAGPGANYQGSFTREVYNFLGLGNNATINTTPQNGETCIKSIGTSGNLASDYTWDFRFVADTPISDNWTYDNGSFGGLKYTGSERNKHIKIRKLKAGDRLYIEAAADQGKTGVQFVLGNNELALVGGYTDGVPYPVNTVVDGVQVPTPLENWHNVTRNEVYYVLKDCDLNLNFPQGSNARLQKVVIDSWHEAEYVVEDVTVDNKPGERFRFTSAGVLRDKRPAVPFLTVQFGSDNYKTYIKHESGFVGTAVSYNSSNDTYVTFSGSGDSAVPSGGSYVYFFPDVDGTLYFKGMQTGDGSHVYVVEKNVDGSGTRTIADFEGNGAKDITDLSLTRGKVYYISSNSWAPSQHPVFQLSEFTFIPDATNYTGALSYVLSTAQKTAGSATFTLDKSYNNLVVKDYLGNVTGATVSLSGNQLSVSNIQYKETVDKKEANKGGVILVYINPLYENGGTNISRKSPVVAITVPYGAEDYANKNSKQIKVWDFYTNSLSLGKSTDQNSLMYQEMHYADGSTDWDFDNLNHYKDAEPVFKSVYEMEGDNADMIEETEGLIFNTPTNNLCIYNENTPNSGAFVDRYVGIRPGGKLTIPQLKAGDRVRMLIGRYGGPSEYTEQANAYVTMTNAKDVSLNVTTNSNGTQTVTEGQLINSDYIIGGTGSRISGGNCVLYGEYNFIVAQNGDFSMEMTKGQLIKFYRIEIYRSEKFITNNAVLKNDWDGSVNAYEVVYTDEDANGSSKILSYNLHNYGKGERIKVMNVDQVTGNLSLNSSSFTENNPGEATSVRCTTNKGDFGAFRLTLGVKTQVQQNVTTNYITDRAERIMAIGYLQKMSYPYTWDFTILQDTKRINLSDYSDISGTEGYILNAINQESNASNIEQDNRRWANTSGYGLRTGCEKTNSTWDEGRGILFASGGQLFAQDKMFEETAGIGFKRNGNQNDDLKKLNYALAIADHGIRLNAVQDPDVYFKMVIPKVPKDAVVYVKAQPTPGATYPKTLCSLDGSTSKNFDKVITGLGNQGLDNVYIMKNDAERDVELWMNGLMIQKIGVSTDEKSIGQYGFVSESRDHKIDHRLTAEFTGQPIKAFIVTETELSSTTDLSEAGYGKAKAQEATVLQENQGCFISNDPDYVYDDENPKDLSVDVIDGKFHLFVPAIHDMDEYSGYTNYMKPMINSGIVRQESDGNINFALSAKHYSQTNPSQVTYGKVGFYRVDKNKDVVFPKNSAYLAVPKGPAAGVKAFYLVMEGAEEPLAEDFGNQDITAVKGIENAADIEGDWYNMNGQKLNGRPNASGIYVVNGKKVVIK